MASLMCARLFCNQCHKYEKFLPIHFVAAVTGCNRSSIYRWINRGWLHSVQLSSGRRLVCRQSLIQAHEIDPSLMTRLTESSGSKTTDRGRTFLRP